MSIIGSAVKQIKHGTQKDAEKKKGSLSGKRHHGQIEMPSV